MPHVAYALHQLHAGQPNTFSVPLLDEADQPIDFGSGSAVEPTLTVYDLAGEQVAGESWPFPMTEDSQVWVAQLGTLAAEVGDRLRIVVTFTDPAGNQVTLSYPAIVVPPV